MNFWAFLCLLALCQARPDKLFAAPPQLYSVPNFPLPVVDPISISPPANAYFSPQFQPQPQPQTQPQPQPQQIYGQPQDGGPAPGSVSCPEGQVDRGDGTCATPQITRNLFLYRVPDEELGHGAAAVLPDPKVDYNFVFIRTAEQAAGQQPLVAPAPQQKTLVYVLNKQQEELAQKVIQQDSKPTKPEVYFVSYKDGENLDLPGGVDLQTALSQSLLQGEVVGNPGGGGIVFPGDAGIASPGGAGIVFPGGAGIASPGGAGTALPGGQTSGGFGGYSYNGPSR